MENTRRRSNLKTSKKKNNTQNTIVLNIRHDFVYLYVGQSGQAGQTAYMQVNVLTLGQVVEAVTDARRPLVGHSCLDEGPRLGHNSLLRHDFRF